MEGALLLQQAEVEDAGDGDGIGVVGHTILYMGGIGWLVILNFV